MTALLTTIKSLVSKLSGTIVGYLAAATALLMGGLIIAFKWEGSRLHRAQIEILAQQIQTVTTKSATSVAAATETYIKSRTAYIKAGGKFVLALVFLFSPTPAKSQSPQSLLPACQQAVRDCDRLTRAQGTEIEVLLKAADKWKAEARKEASPLFTVGGVAVMVTGVGIVGYVLGRLHK